MPEKPVESKIIVQARCSWLFPLLAWLSQIVLGLTLRTVPGLGVFWALIAVVQLVLMVLGLYYSIRILALGRTIVGNGNWGAAFAGLLLSGGSLLLIAGLIFGILRI